MFVSNVANYIHLSPKLLYVLFIQCLLKLYIVKFYTWFLTMRVRCPAHLIPPRVYSPNNIRWAAQIVRLLSMQLSPLSCFFLRLRSKFYPPALKDLKFEVPTAMTMKITLIPCSLKRIFRRFRGTCLLAILWFLRYHWIFGTQDGFVTEKSTHLITTFSQ